MKLKKKESKSELKELSRIGEALEKLVYLSEFQLKSAGANIKYPKKEG